MSVTNDGNPCVGGQGEEDVPALVATDGRAEIDRADDGKENEERFEDATAEASAKASISGLRRLDCMVSVFPGSTT